MTGQPNAVSTPNNPDSLPPLLRFWQWPGIAILLVLALGAFAPVLGGHRFAYGSDTVTHDFVMHLWGWQRIMVGRGEWPLWCPHLFSGLPFLGSYALCPLYPTGWLQWVLPMPVAFSLQYVLALVVGGAGMVRLARQLGCQRRVALGAGIAMMVSGHFLTLVHAGHLQKMIAVGWSPWVLAAALGLGRLGVRRQLPDGSWLVAILGWPAQWLILTVALALQMLAGHPQIFYASVFMAAAVVMPWRLLRPGFLMRHPWPVVVHGWLAVFRVGLAAAVALALSAPQTLPGLETGSVSNRSAGVTYAEATATSYPPAELLEYVIPSVFGDSVRGSLVPYFGFWGERIVSDFLGVSVLMLAGVGWWALRRWSPSHLRRGGRTAWVLASLAGLSLLIGIGRHTPLYLVLWAILPGFGSFRSPGTFMFVANLAVLALAAVGTQALVQGWNRRGPSAESLGSFRALWGLPMVAGIGVVLALIALYQNLGVRLDLATGLENRRWKLYAGMGSLGAQLALASLLIHLALRASGIGMRRGVVAILGTGTVAFMAWSNSRYIRFEPLAPFQAYLNQETWRAASRPGTPHSPGAGEWARILDENDLLVAMMAQDAGTPTGYHPLVLARHEILRSFVPTTSPDFGAIMAINYARTRSEDPPPARFGNFERVARQSVPTTAFLWRRAEPFPPIREGVSIRAVSDLSEGAAVLADGVARKLTGQVAVVVDDDLERVPTMQEGPQIVTGARLHWDGPNRGRIQLGARPSGPVVLPLAIPFAPGWQAHDHSGRELPVIPVDIGGLAVVLPPGTTGVELRYGPFSFRLGMFLMLLTAGCIGVVAARRIRG